MLTLKEIVQFRLEELGLGPIEAAVAAGIERTFIRDIVEDKKKSVRSDKIAELAAALKLDASALARNEIMRIDDKTRTPEAELQSALVAYGIDREDLPAVMKAISGFLSPAAELPQSDRPRDQFEPANPRREVVPSR